MLSMGNYRCYSCNKEFILLRGLKKHYDNNKCPSITPEMRTNMIRPFFRVISRIEFVDPTKINHREQFLLSYRVATNETYDYKERLIENAKDIGKYLDNRRFKPGVE